MTGAGQGFAPMATAEFLRLPKSAQDHIARAEREVEGLRKQVAAMQAVVNAASLWEAADANNEDGDDDSDEGYETALALCDAIEAYRVALSPASGDNT